MDSISQAVLGAAIGLAVLGKQMPKRAALVGAIVATIPDLDVLFFLLYDKYDMLSIHRGFSHSIVCSVLAATVLTLVVRRLKWASAIYFQRLWWCFWLCWFTHIMLDAFTAYGTQLFLPFSDQRFGFDSINVVDPLYTIPLIMGLVTTLWLFKNRPNRAIFNTLGLAISTLYLLFTLWNKSCIDNHFTAIFDDEIANDYTLLTMPVGVANINWYGVAKTKDSIYMQAYALTNQHTNRIFTFPINEHYLNDIDPGVADKMRWFAKGFYTVDKVGDKTRIYNLQVDMRGILYTDSIKAPTLGYFEIGRGGQKSDVGYGSIRKG